MLTVFVFDERESRREEDLRPALDGLGEKALLWLALRDPTEEEVALVQEAFELQRRAGTAGCSSSRPALLWWTRASTCM